MPPEIALPRVVEDVPEFPARPVAMHKGAAGKVAIIAGSRGMSGAAILAGLGALRGGAGLVRVYCPESVQSIVAASEPCFMTVPLPEDDAGRIAGGDVAAMLDVKWPTVVAVGPGLGVTAELGKLVADVLHAFPGPVVVDADGLNNLAARGPQPGIARATRATIITPHPGEMARLRQGAGLPPLTGDDDETRVRIAHEYACFSQCVVVLKGQRTVVCTPSDAYINTTGNPGMATGGMGDVLTGLLTALLGQGLSAFDAARLGVYCHGLAADFCHKEIGPVGYLAREVADLLPAALTHAARPRVGFHQAD
jgi:NAD(P)H-hydrate epimerase